MLPPGADNGLATPLLLLLLLLLLSSSRSDRSAGSGPLGSPPLWGIVTEGGRVKVVAAIDGLLGLGPRVGLRPRGGLRLEGWGRGEGWRVAATGGTPREVPSPEEGGCVGVIGITAVVAAVVVGVAVVAAAVVVVVVAVGVVVGVVVEGEGWFLLTL